MRRHIKLGLVASGAAVMVGLLGCATDPQQQAMRDPQQRRLAMARMYGDYFDEAAANAIFRQATVFPHHFVPHTALLTDLGRHELAILATHLRANPGEVRLRRGPADDALYEARSRAVLAFLQEREVNPGSVKIIDARPDGDGIASERVMDAIAREKDSNKTDLTDRAQTPMLRQGNNNASTTTRKSM